LANKLK